MYKIDDLVKFNNSNSIGILKQKLDKEIWKVSTISGNLNTSEKTFSKFDRKESLVQIRKSLVNVNWRELELKSYNCPECKRMISLFKDLIS